MIHLEKLGNKFFPIATISKIKAISIKTVSFEIIKMVTWKLSQEGSACPCAKIKMRKVRSTPCQCIIEMVLRHDWTPKQSTDIFWKRVRVAGIDIFIDVLNIDRVFRDPTSTSNRRNIHIEPLTGAWIICRYKNAWLLTPTNNTNNFYRGNRRDIIL